MDKAAGTTVETAVETAAETAELAGRLSELGIVAIILFLFLLFLFATFVAIAWGAKRTLGANGIAERITAAHLHTLSNLDQMMTEIVQIVRRQETTSKTTDSSVRAMLASQTVTSERMEAIYKVAHRSVVMLRGVAVEMQWPDVTEHLDEIDKMLEERAV